MTSTNLRNGDRSRFSFFLRNENRDLSPFLIGVSGGVDSIYLLHRFHQAGRPVIAAVFNHGLRPEAAEECEFTAAFCAERNIPCVQGSGDVAAYAAEHSLGIEEAARKLRYQFLFRTAEEQGCAAVATAHHANDQAETVLMHILRGAGTDGLSGMREYELPNAFSKTIPLIRPLLGLTRAEIESSAREAGLTWREDRSNTDPAYTRNRIRLDLIPKLESEYNPQIVRALCRLAETTAADKDILERTCSEMLLYAGLLLRKGDSPVFSCRDLPERPDLLPCSHAEWSRKVYQNAAEGLRLRMLRMIFSFMDLDLSDIGYINLKEADRFFLNGRINQTIPFITGIWLRCEGDKALILTKINNTQWKYPQFSQGWDLSVETADITEKELPDYMEKARLHPETAILDANQIASWPFLRKPIRGERFDPYGNRGHTQKISDFLINSKIPLQYRSDLLVAADEAGIIWIPGLRVSNRCALNRSTRHIMILRLIK
ncbi:MAG: tRNA lysidine(34) synthetase TilS [Anaerolineaceae bacterium]|nr:tRNA lysidine(34) synthetase TilS [Anaerolineaceae bacterium]